MFDVAPELFPLIEGSTDSETLFFLALTFGLRSDPLMALARTMGHVERARKAAGIEPPIYFSACTTDGQRLWSVRYSSNNQSFAPLKVAGKFGFRGTIVKAVVAR